MADKLTAPAGYFSDTCGNLRSIPQYEIRDGKLFVSYHFVLEPGKTTLRGEYPKLAEPPKCIHPDRLSCNYGEGFNRCECMKYVNGRWCCTTTG